jgi:T-complex protein 1 subunit theta
MTTLQLPKNPGAQLFKEGYQNLQGVDDAIVRNINAVYDLASIVRTSFGCYGRNKIVLNHLQKMFLTNDAGTIIRELDVIHPAAKLMIMASQQQEQEVGY